MIFARNSVIIMTRVGANFVKSEDRTRVPLANDTDGHDTPLYLNAGA